MNTTTTLPRKNNRKSAGIRRMIIKLSRKLSLVITWRPQARVSRLLAMMLGAAVAGPALALPTGEQVVSGDIGVASSGTSMTITQTTDKGIIDWASYGISADEVVRYLQPGASSVTLNRVVGGDPTEIFGQLSANGQIFIINPMGVLFAPGAQVNVGGLVASTLDIGNDDFLSGNYSFANGTGAGSVQNQGDISATRYVAFLAPQISNSGIVTADGGTVAFAAGDRVTLGLNGDSLISVSVDAAAAGAAINHSGTVRADGGQVFMTAKSADALMDTVLNVSGVVRAQSISEQNGVIRLDGGSAGVVSVSGSLDAQGGEIVISGEWVGNTGTISANDAGKITIDSLQKTVMMSTSVIEAKGGGEVRINQPGAEGFTGARANTSTVMYQGAVIDTTGGADNGFVEVSGAAIDVDAGTIKAGAILFDPLNITFSNAADANVTGFAPPDLTEAFTDDAGLTSNFRVDGTGILNTVAAGSTITFQATNDITVSNAFNLQTATTQANVSLVLDAGHDINVDAAVTADGTGSIVMTAVNTIDSTGFGITTGGGAVTLNAATMSLGAINTGAGLLTISNSGAATQSGVFAGTGGLTKTGAGTLTLSQTNTYTGTTSIDAGTLTLGASNVLANASDISVNGGTLALGANSDTVTGVTLISGSITGTTGVLTANTYAVESGTISAILGDRTGGTSTLTKTTAGEVTLSGNNAYEGLTTVSAGTLTVGHANGLGTTDAGTTVADGATLNINAVTIDVEALTVQGAGVGAGGAITGSGSLAGAITLAGDTTVGVASGTLTLSGVIDDGASTFGLTKSGAGNLVLSANNNYDGLTQVGAGTLTAQHNSALGDAGGGTNVASSATLTIQSVTVGEGIAVAAGGTLALTGAAVVTPQVGLDGTLDYSGYGSAVTFGLGGTATGLTGGWTTTGTPTVIGRAGSDTISGTGQTYSLVDGVPDAGSNGTVSWTEFENINDATGTVDFNVSGSVTGNVTAQTLDYTAYTQDLTLDITNDTITNGGVGGTLSGVSTVNANTAQNNTVTGTGETYSLTDATPDAGSGGGYSWTAFQNIDDATGTVDFNASGSVTGNVTAATLDYSGYGSDLTLNVTTDVITNDGVGGTLSGVSTVNANTAQNNTVTGTGETYSLTDATPDAGSGSGYSWTAFQNIDDATGTVDFNASGSVTGNVTAATLDYSGYGSDLTLNVTTDMITNDGVGGTLSGVSTVNANTAQNNTVTGTAETYSLTDATPDAGSGSGYSWTAFQNIDGATGTVDFNASGSVTGNVTAATLDYTAYTQDLTLDITNDTITNGGVGGTLSGVSTVNANAAQTNTVTGTAETYSLTDATPDAGSGSGYSWTAFENISDATGTVDFNASGSVTGNVTAATLDYSGYGAAVTFNLDGGASTGMAGWSGVTTVTGSVNSDTVTGANQTYNLTALDVGNNGTVFWTSMETVADTGTGTVSTTGGQTFNLTGANQGTTGLLTGGFTGIGNLTDTGAATFNMGTAGGVSADLTASGGSVNYASYSSAVNFDLDGGGSTGIGGTWTGITTVTGSGNSDTLTGTGETWNMTGTNAGDNGTVFWTSFENLTDSGNGTYNGSGGSSISGALTNTGTATLSGTISAGSVDLQDAVTLAADTTVTASTVSFASTVDSATATARDLTVNGAASFGDDVGVANDLGNVYVSGAASIADGVTIVTTQDQNYVGPLHALGDVTFTSLDGMIDTYRPDNQYDGVVTASSGSVTEQIRIGTATTDLAINTVTSGYEIWLVSYGDLSLGTVTAPTAYLYAGTMTNANTLPTTPNLVVTNNVYLNSLSGDIGVGAITQSGGVVTSDPDKGIRFTTTLPSYLYVYPAAGQAALTVDNAGDIAPLVQASSASYLNNIWECTAAECTNLQTGEIANAASSTLSGILNAAAQDLFNSTFGTDNIRVSIQNGFLTTFGVVPPGIDAIDGDGVNVPASSVALLTDPPATWLYDEEELKRKNLKP